MDNGCALVPGRASDRIVFFHPLAQFIPTSADFIFSLTLGSHPFADFFHLPVNLPLGGTWRVLRMALESFLSRLIDRAHGLRCSVAKL